MVYQKKRSDGVINRVYRYKLKPRKSHVVALESALLTQQKLYNRALEMKSRLWKEERRSISHGELQKLLITQARKTDPWIAGASRRLCAQTLKRLDLAFQAFFRRVKAGETPGYPKFKTRKSWNTLQYDAYGLGGCALKGESRVYLQNIGTIKFHLYRPLPEGASIRGLSVISEPNGWFLALTLEIPFIAPEPPESPATGIDLGVKAFVTDAAGNQWAPENFLRRAQARLARHQQALQPLKKGTEKRRRVVRLIRKAHHRIFRQRREWHRRVAKELVVRYGPIFFEKLTPRTMVRRPKPRMAEDGKTFLPNGAKRKSGMNKSILDAGWAGFLRALVAAAEKRGVRAEAVAAHNTTQRCSCCGGMPDEKMTLRVRTYKCAHCGHVQDRDHNAARNILALGLAASLPEIMPLAVAA